MTFIIAEAGVNHNGCVERAHALVDAAYKAGADAVKFQTFTANALVTAEAKQASYQARNTGKSESQSKMLQRLELDRSAHRALLEHCKSLNIEFLSSAFDTDSLDFLTEDLSLRRLKVASGEITNAPFLIRHAQKGCDIILSTGMCSLADVECALSALAYGFLNPDTSVNQQPNFAAAYASPAGRRALIQHVTVLHCTTEYPAPINEVNLRAMQTLAASFGLPVGYSDHSSGITIPIAAVACGAQVIEKHFTLDRTLPGPDHKASLEPPELAAMVQAIRQVESALGDGIKRATDSEIANKAVARKSLVASRAIKRGQLIQPEDLVLKRPGTGLSGFDYWRVVDRASRRDYQAGDIIIE
ncbi:N-acetylneuraminate synthase [Aliidiomarina maris]|uniref:N-acetylneuraminate synthase n=1 Tax=Aliidiomarina maris TaxID=531312 RepID=A0A327X3E2_9GAMM|nr:N-acetylneuraminate synthase [Aliidiomarina maris]RAK00732.1 N-acetylneuraminate synthase [Aliidiomarina maris]RUO27269.1 N-acetylneuraminate synthase [Aliidiomarina maris]